MKLPSPIACVFGSALLVCRMVTAADLNTPSLAYLEGTAQERQDGNSGFNLLTLNIESLSDEEAFDLLVEQLLWVNADVLCLQGVAIADVGAALFERLRDQYAHFYVETEAPYGLFVASRCAVEDARFAPFGTDEELFDFFQSAYSFEDKVGECYSIEITSPSGWLGYPSVLASITELNQLDDSSGFYWDNSSMLFCAGREGGSVGISGGADLEGGRDVGARAEYYRDTDRGGRVTVDVEAGMRRDKDGNTSGEMRGGVKYDFNS